MRRSHNDVQIAMSAMYYTLSETECIWWIGDDLMRFIFHNQLSVDITA